MGDGVPCGEGRREQQRRNHQPNDNQSALGTAARYVADGHLEHDLVAHRGERDDRNSDEEERDEERAERAYRDAE